MNQSKYLAPTYLEKFSYYDNEMIYKKFEREIEWKAQIKSSQHNGKFKIKYYGDIEEEYGLIVGTDFSEAIVIAEDVETKDQIILFDGCMHGYNAMFCDEYSKEQINNRPLTYLNESEIVKVFVKVYHGIDYDSEIDDYLNSDHMVELLSGKMISIEDLKRDGFDFISIEIVDENGNKKTILEEELA